MGDVPGTKVWVGNLGSTCEERDLRDEFSKFGELNKVCPRSLIRKELR